MIERTTDASAGLPPSLWAATAVPGPDTPALCEPVFADVVVVGGGFTGISTALHAAEGGADVVLLEAGEPGFGASGRNGGQVVPGLKLQPDEVVKVFGPRVGERFVRFGGECPDLLFSLIERHGIDCAASRDGHIVAVHSERLLPQMEDRQRQWRKLGVELELFDREETNRRTGAAGYVAGLLDRRGGSLNPLSLARGIARAAIKAGARIYGLSPATTLRRIGDKWRVGTPNGAVFADQVVLATNGYTDGLWPGLAQSIVPVYSYQLATKPLSDNIRSNILPDGHVVSDTRRLLAYFRKDPEGRLVLGGRGLFRDTAIHSSMARCANCWRESIPTLSNRRPNSTGADALPLPATVCLSWRNWRPAY